MKYCVVILDGASGWALPGHGGKTCLELADTPNLNAMALEGTLGLARTVPEGMEASSACACMSVLGYDPRIYYKGRAGIEARSMGIPVGKGEVVFRCNLVAVRDGRMWDYSAGHISTDEAKQLIKALNEKLGSEQVQFYPGVSYRHICRIKGQENTLLAACTPPHDIPDQPINKFLPKGQGSEFLLDLMRRSEDVLREHPVNVKRRSRGEIPATALWFFWGSGQIPDMPTFEETYGLRAAMTSGVDLLRGLAQMLGIYALEIPGVTDGLDNDYTAQATGALEALADYDLVAIHIEAPDEAAHEGSVEDKVKAIERIDREVLGLIHAWRSDVLRVLVIPDHPTPIEIRTHCPDPVPFLLWGDGFKANGGKRFTEIEAQKRGLLIEEGYTIMGRLTTRL
jgi:2,3-bisphosphoglycerate-independent phosphoglycerate mutase